MRRSMAGVLFHAAALLGAFGVLGTTPGGPVTLEEAWVPLPAMKHAADGVTAVATDTQLFVFGGSTNNSHSSNNGIKAAAAFSLAAKTWNPLPTMPNARCCAGGELHNGEIYVIGGMQNDDVISDVDVFNVTAGGWRSGPALNTPRCCMATVVFNNEVWVLGGGDNHGFALDSIEVLGLKTKKWKEGPAKLAEPRTFFAAAAFEDSIIVVGGQLNYDARTCVQKFYPGSPSRGWLSLTAPSTAHRAFAATHLGNFLLVLGGMGQDGGLEPIAKVEGYDMKHDEWYSLVDLPGARDCAAAVVSRDKLFVLGGFGPTDRQGKVLGDVVQARVQLPRGAGKSAAPKEPGKNHHLPLWILALLILGGGAYGSIGGFLNYREGARGMEMMPHFEFWLELPSLVLDGAQFAATAVAGSVVRPALSKVGVGGYQPLPEEDNPW